LNRCSHVFFTNEETRFAFIKQNIQIEDSKWSYHCDIGVSESNISLVENNVNEGVTFLIPGRLNYRKGHELLFDAIPRISFDKKVVYKIVGVGPLEKKLKRIVDKDEYLKHHVQFLGRISYTEMNNEYDKSNVVILPSLSEATGTVLIEALSRSRAVITGKFFGAKFLLDDDCSWLFYGSNKKEIVRSLNGTLISAITNTNSIVEKGINANKRVQKYTWNEKIKLFNTVYERVLTNPEEKG
jgi:phosphatidylinositol glycan class A protein